MINLRIDKDLVYSIPVLIESNEQIIRKFKHIKKTIKGVGLNPFSEEMRKSEDKLTKLKSIQQYIENHTNKSEIERSLTRYYKYKLIPSNASSEQQDIRGSPNRINRPTSDVGFEPNCERRPSTRELSKFSLLKNIQYSDNKFVENLIFVEFYPDQFAAVVVQPGCTICQVLYNQMNNRKLKLENCDIINYRNAQLISWNCESQDLSMTMIVVIPKHKRHHYRPTLRSHEIKNR
ncbi:hypothetical protein RF11_05817 [Thelohanellus kitauei]|uniref:Uncharacterized protein n=1 Tax=Thelohanellus kitauei TaxID=669202 RepID=A0A0C2M226_THEKT|nr:hypothetical protein RF11_05817 [Thelohanellus kitauei]